MKSELETHGYYTLRGTSAEPLGTALASRETFFALVEELQTAGRDFKSAFFEAARRKPQEYALAFGEGQ